MKHQRTILSLAIAALLVFAGLPASGAREAEPVWQAQKSGVLARLSAVFFLDRNTGWAAGSNGTLLRTEDGGAQWKRAALSEQESKEPINDLWFFDAARGCVLGEYGRFNRRLGLDWTERIFVLNSRDGGANWALGELSQQPVITRAGLSGRSLSRQNEKQAEKTAEKTGENARPPDPVLLRMAFVNDRVGWSCGEAGSIQHTRDGGATWQLQGAATKKLLYDLAAISERQVFIVGAGGTILVTMDGGRSWSERSSGVTKALRAVHFLDARIGWVAGSDGTILATNNGGAAWTPQETGVKQNFNDIFFVSPTEGWAAGDRGALVHTVDGGATWQLVELDTHANLSRLAFVAPDCGWVVGMSGAIFRFGPTGSAH
ncbi:MAG: YCF48-related protein [Blastocatellia bacterium]|nr:YCF48-related protein [Blastocatellia bacterium]